MSAAGREPRDRRRHHLGLVTAVVTPALEPPDDECADLLAVAQRVAAQAGAGEQIEAFVGRSSYTSVKAYGGEVESFTVGHDRRRRHPGHPRPPPGLRLGRHARRRRHRRRAGRGARQRHLRRARRVGRPGRARRRRPGAVRRLRPGAWPRCPPSARSSWPSSSSAWCAAATPGSPACASPSFADSSGERRRGHQHRHRRRSAGARRARLAVLALANDGDETKIGSGSTVGFGPDDLDLDEAAGDAVAAVHPPVRRHGRAVAAPGHRARAPAGRQRGRACSAAPSPASGC